MDDVETHADLNTRFWQLVHGDGNNPVYPSHVQRMLLENIDTTTENSTIDIDTRRGVEGYTPLTMAIKAGNIGVVRVLLAHGADCNLSSRNLSAAGICPVMLYRNADVFFETPLSCAIFQVINGPEMMRLLFSAGASATAVEEDGTTFLHLIFNGGPGDEFESVTDQIEKMCILLANIPPMELPRLLSSQRGCFDETPLTEAIEMGGEDNVREIIVLMLIDAGSDLELVGQGQHSCHTPMSSCVMRRERLGSSIVQAMLNHGARTETPSGTGKGTALHQAVQHRSGWAIELLLAAGADPHARNRRGESPLWTCTRRYPELLPIFAAAEAVRDAKRLALTMGQHHRLGAGSRLLQLPESALFRSIIEAAFPPFTAPCEWCAVCPGRIHLLVNCPTQNHQ